MEGSSLFKALSILGLPPTFNISTLNINDIKLPQSVVKRLGHTFTCQLRESTLAQELLYVKYILRDLLTANESRWGVLDFVALEIPSYTLNEDVELVDAPSFTCSALEMSLHLTSVVERTKRLIHVCDERKLDGDFTRFLKSYFLEKLCWPGIYRLAIICNKRYTMEQRGISSEILQQVRPQSRLRSFT